MIENAADAPQTVPSARQMETSMIEFNRILCPVDFSESSTRALAHAAALARWYDAQLTVLHVVPTFDPVQVRAEIGVPVQILNPITRDEVAESMQPLLERAGVLPEAHVVVVAEEGDASTAIVDQALTTRADVIVIGTHGRRGFKRLLLGSVTETVLHEAPCPVLTVSPHTEAATSDVVTFKRILCPIDFSPSALQALGFALDLARQADGRVTLLHVFEWLPEDEPRSSAHFNVPEFRNYMVADAADRLRALVTEESRAWCEIDDVIVSGRAHREILRVAEAQSSDLIVMGAQGRGGVGLALFGSTTQQIVRSAPCPVLTVRGVPAG
jgi:nucleotide-binding universal stress UspA family protein